MDLSAAMKHGPPAFLGGTRGEEQSSLLCCSYRAGLHGSAPAMKRHIIRVAFFTFQCFCWKRPLHSPLGHAAPMNDSKQYLSGVEVTRDREAEGCEF